MVKKLVLSILLVMLVNTVVFSQHPVIAAQTKEMYVDAKGDIYLRELPEKDATKVGIIKNHSKVTVISSTKVWAYVKTGKEKGYVYTSALSNKKPKAIEMYVNAKSDIILRDQPNKNAKTIDMIKNHSKVILLSSSKGWSYVQSGKNKGYVYTSALSKKAPKAVASTVTKGLTPKDGLVLTYNPSFLEFKKETFFVEKEGDYSYLYNKESSLYPNMPNYTYVEDKEEFLVGVANSDFIFFTLTYPLVQGKYTIDNSLMFKERKVLIESTTKTVKVKAGTFNNVVIIKFPDGSREYLAKGIGVIKSTNAEGKTITELVAIKEGK